MAWKDNLPVLKDRFYNHVNYVVDLRLSWVSRQIWLKRSQSKCIIYLQMGENSAAGFIKSCSTIHLIII